jgi:hypothetical protein
MECTRLVAAAVVVGGTIGIGRTSTGSSAPGGPLVADLLGDGEQTGGVVVGPVPADLIRLAAGANRAW